MHDLGRFLFLQCVYLARILAYLGKYTPHTLNVHFAQGFFFGRLYRGRVDAHLTKGNS
jgi:hypothetical protein